MRIHILASHATRAGGADIYTSELVSRLVQRGADVQLFCHSADPAIRTACSVHLVDRGRSQAWPLIWRFAPYIQPFSVLRSLHALGQPAPDVVLGMAHQIIWAHRHKYGARPLIYLPHSLIAPVEVSTYSWQSSLQRTTAVAFWRREEYRCLRRAFSTVRFTETARSLLQEYYRLPASTRMDVLPIPVDGPARPQRNREAVAPLHLLAVGRLVASKNFGFLISLLKEYQGRHWQLDVLGDGEEREALASSIELSGLSSQIVLRGHVDPSNFYEQADLLVMPSLLENAPLVILEAMTHGVPTLAFRPDGVRFRSANHEMIRDRVDGLLVENEPDFAAALGSIIQSPQQLDPLRASARARVAEKHSWDRHLDGLQSLLASAAAQR